MLNSLKSNKIYIFFLRYNEPLLPLKRESHYNTFQFKFVPSIISFPFPPLLKWCISHSATKLFILAFFLGVKRLWGWLTAPQLCSQTTDNHRPRSDVISRQTNWLFSFSSLSSAVCFSLSSSLVSFNHSLFFLISSLMVPLLFLLHFPYPIFPHLSISLSLSISASSSSVDTLGGGTGCVEGSAGQLLNRRFSIGWSSSWFSSTLWPSPLNITSSLSG